MLSRNDPRVRRAIDQLAQNLESANERTQEGLYSFTHAYLHPCLSSTANCLGSCNAPCCSHHEDRKRRNRSWARSQGRAEFSFNFYDDWEQNETDALLVAPEDDGETGQPRSESQMHYGTRQADGVRPKDSQEYSTKNISSSSYFGFMDKLPFKIGTRVLKYHPSVADLREHPASRQGLDDAAESSLQQSLREDELTLPHENQKRRVRSATQGSTRTNDSLSSRGDIFPSDDEMDDAVPIDDEFALALERRTTGTRSSSHLSIVTTSSKSSLNRSRRVPAKIEQQHLNEPFTTSVEAITQHSHVDKFDQIPHPAPRDSPSPSLTVGVVDMALPRSIRKHHTLNLASPPLSSLTDTAPNIPKLDVETSVAASPAAPSFTAAALPDFR